MKKILTLCLIRKDDEVLLGMKKRGHGEGRWNGFGGKLLDGESIMDAALRELEEESGLKLLDIEKCGVVTFSYEHVNEIMEVHVFKGSNFVGEPKETEEMRPQWFGVNEIPFDSMWPDDKHWFPCFLDNKFFKGDFYFSDYDTIREHKINEISGF